MLSALSDISGNPPLFPDNNDLFYILRTNRKKEVAMTFITAARFSKRLMEKDENTRIRADQVQRHLEEIALDVGLDPKLNVTRAEADEEVRIGISEYMDQYYREAPGAWRYY